MRLALDTSILVAFFLPEDKLHEKAKEELDRIIKNQEEYACISILSVIEMGYVLERIKNKNFAYNAMYSVMYEIPIDVVEVSWDFIVKLSHLKAVNPISFCDNATLAAADMSSCKALFTREKEVVSKATKLSGPEIIFLEDLNGGK